MRTNDLQAAIVCVDQIHVENDVSTPASYWESTLALLTATTEQLVIFTPSTQFIQFNLTVTNHFW